MFTSRALWISFIGAIAIAGALSACATQAESPTPAAVGQCYWLSNADAGWVARPDLPDADLCFEMDSCSGGVGLSGGGCYKWATSPNAPATPWSDLGFMPLSRDEPSIARSPTPACYLDDDEQRLISDARREAQCFALDSCRGGLGQGLLTYRERCFKWAIAPNAPALPWSAALTSPPPPGADIPPPPDTCLEEPCGYAARVTVDTPIFAFRDLSSPQMGTVSAGEPVLVVVASFASARRGVVIETHREFTAGDVIYLLDVPEAGFHTYWWRGSVIGDDSELAVRWDDVDPQVGLWYRFARSNGTRGWAWNPVIVTE